MANESIPEKIVINIENEDNINTSKRSKTTSKVWEQFVKVPTEEKDCIKAQCKLCKNFFSAPSKNGTSHLLRHMSKCPKRLNKDIRQCMLSSQTSTDGTSSVKNYKFDQDFIRREIGLMVVYDEHPFSLVEAFGFRRVMEAACPQFKMMGRKTIKRDVMTMHMKEKAKVREYLGKVPGRISLTSDAWESVKGDHYICVTSHFIDHEWNLQKRILGFKLIAPPYDGLSIADIIASCIVHWNIEHKVFSITLDNASVNDVVATNLKARLLAKNLLPSNGKFFQVRCCAHILNLIVQAGMQLMDSVICKLRLGIKYVKQSPIRRKSFDSVALSFNLDTRKKLCTDCPTRWNATYLMIESAIYYKNAFLHMGQRDSNFTMKLSDEEWEKIDVLHKFLKVFYEVTCIFSGTKYPTSNLYFQGVWKIHARLLEILSGPNNFMMDMVRDMHSKFSKYWSEYSVILSCAAVLDPRYKVKFVEYCFTKLYGSNSAEHYVNSIVSTLYELFDQYMQQSTSLRVGESSVVQIVDSNDDFMDYDLFQSKRARTQIEKSQLDLYLEEPSHDLNSELDVLGYWSACSLRYPELSKMARDILSIPVLTVDSESTFSTGRRVISSFRSSLKPNIVEALICLQDWMRALNRKGNMDNEDDDSDSFEEDTDDQNDY